MSPKYPACGNKTYAERQSSISKFDENISDFEEPMNSNGKTEKEEQLTN